MYEELIESSRACAMRYNGNCDRCLFCGMSNDKNGECYQQLHKAAAEAIERLEKACEEAYNKGLLEGGIAQRAEDEKWLSKWIPVTEENDGEV